MSVYLGIDVGTSGTKTLGMRRDGRILATATVEYPLSSPRPGWSEQNPEDWWQATIKSVRAVLKKGKIKPAEVSGIGLSGQMHGSVFLDSRQQVIRPAILWNDQRTSAECAEIESRAGGRAQLIELVANPALTGFTAPKILWLRKHEPRHFDRVKQVLLPKDYVRFRLTGEFATEVSDASGTLLLDVQNRRWCKTLLDLLQLDQKIKDGRIKQLTLRQNEIVAVDRLGNLYAGSWISHNFAIWIGHHEDNTAWDLLYQTRQFLLQAQAQVAPDALARAWEEMYIAEGSDWFWWFGDDHSSAQDELFDQLFRKHLQNVYTCLGTQPPSLLNRPITRLVRRTIHSEPKGFLAVKVDGRRTYFEWINAGHYISGSERGTMTLVTEGVIREVYFGFDIEQLMLRVDTARSAQDDLGRVQEVRVQFLEPQGYEIRIADPAKPSMQARLYRNREILPQAEIKVAVAQILELTVCFADLGLEPEAPIHLFVEIVAEGQSVDRAPREGALEMRVPGPDYEKIMWQA
jgi:hypothetical protein